jgi:hypothetical protein
METSEIKRVNQEVMTGIPITMPHGPELEKKNIEIPESRFSPNIKTK